MRHNFKLLVLLLLGIQSQFISAQDFTLNCGTKETPYDNGNKSHFEIIMECPYFETDTNHIPQNIMDTARKYLINRVGLVFYKRLSLYQCQIVNFKKHEVINGQYLWMGTGGGNKKIRYSIQYYFLVQDSMRYYLTLAFNKNGKVLSNPQMPDIKQNAQFDKIIDLCDIVKTAEQDTTFRGQVMRLSLEYSNTENAFVWIVEKPSVKGPKPRTEINRRIVVNANNGKIIKYVTENCRIICEEESF